MSMLSPELWLPNPLDRAKRWYQRMAQQLNAGRGIDASGATIRNASGQRATGCDEPPPPVPCTDCLHIASAIVTISGVTLCGCTLKTPPFTYIDTAGSVDGTYSITSFDNTPNASGRSNSSCYGAVSSSATAKFFPPALNCSGPTSSVATTHVSLIYVTGTGGLASWIVQVGLDPFTSGDDSFFLFNGVVGSGFCPSGSTISGSCAYTITDCAGIRYAYGGSATVTFTYM